MYKKTLLSVIFIGLSLCQFCHADYLDDIGYTALQIQLGGATPDGSGVTITQVEADYDASSAIAYMPDTSDIAFGSVTISNATTSPSYTSSSTSAHATMVGKLIYGADSMASGVTNVSVYNANDWIVNRLGYGSNPFNSIKSESADVANHSWVGSTGSTTSDENILRRLDYSINSSDYVAVVGVNNGTGNDQNLLSSAYNVISVGVSSGNHSSALTTVNGSGRLRVQLVVPTSTTSEATAVVSSASALLIEKARNMGSPNGAKSETIKATLLAGATKDTLSSWSRTSTSPLDSTYGAGQLNIQNSYNILAAGEQEASTNSTDYVGSTGWDYDTVSSASDQTYYLTLAQDFSLSIALTWNVAVSGTNATTLTNTLYDLNLALYSVGESGLTLVDESISSVDNIEYIWQDSLTAGNYAIVVSSESSTSWDYSLAWLSELSVVAVPEPSTLLLLLAGIGPLLAFRRTKRLH